MWHTEIRWHTNHVTYTKWSPTRSCDIPQRSHDLHNYVFEGLQYLLKELFCDEELDPDSSTREGRCRGLAVCERREDERTGEEGRISMNSLGGVILRPVTLSFLLSLRTILPCDCDCVGMGEENRGEEREGEEGRERGRGRHTSRTR